jgi:hypothetical protein
MCLLNMLRTPSTDGIWPPPLTVFHYLGPFINGQGTTHRSTLSE